VCLDVIECESLHHRADCTELRGFLQRAIVVPLVDQYAFDEPQGRGAVSTGAMNERGLIAWFPDKAGKQKPTK
jgi:hypothetical protein